MSATVIAGAVVFDGRRSLGVQDVVLEGGMISGVGTEVPAGAQVVDGTGRTLLPGLIDAHVHTSRSALALDLTFGVTTALEMQGTHTRHNRQAISDDDTVADVRSAGFGITPPGGHPSELFPKDFQRGPGGKPGGEPGPGAEHIGPAPFMPFSTTPREAVAAIARLVENGSDYIKFMVDDGSVEGTAVPMLDRATLDAGVAEAKRLGVLTIGHALTIEATRMCADAGIDGLAHIFMDQPHTDEIITLIADSGMFVVPCVVLNASMIGITGAELADDPRVSRHLDAAWDTTLRSSFGHYPQGRLEDVLATVRALRDAGVRLLTGTDASVPLPFLGGLAHGASVHHELQYLVRSGLTPEEALTAATATPAQCFGLDDRGRIAAGLRADLLLVDGDPLTTIGDTLNIAGVWRRGTPLAAAA
jgi:imidazolonepropionase-like amidohydrolase